MSGLPMSSNRRAQRQQKQRETALQAAMEGGGDDNESAKRKAVMDVVQLWLDRLQLVSVITSFFASIDGTLLSFATSLSHIDNLNAHQWSSTVQTMNATLAGALVFHVCAAITSFVGSFVLIRYKLNDAEEHTPRPSHARSRSSTSKAEFSPRSDLPHLVSSAPPLSKNNSESHGSDHVVSDAAHVLNLFSVWQSWSDSLTDVQGRISVHRVHLITCMPSSSGTHVDPPVKLLANCHTLSVTMAIIGFILGLTGILTTAWSLLPTSVATFASTCLGACGIAIFLTLTFS